LTKSKKSRACATADDLFFEAIPRGAETEYERETTLCSFRQLRNEIADGRTIIELWKGLMSSPCLVFEFGGDVSNGKAHGLGRLVGKSRGFL
jgi:hypothetical protein